MANSISSVTTGTGGIVLESVDTSGNTNIKSGTTTIVAVTSTGAAVTGTLSSTGNTTLGDASTDTLNVGNGDLIKDASGNVGVGVTPSAISAGKIVEVGYKGNTFWGNSASAIYITANAYYNGGWTYGSTNAAGNYQINAGVHAWSTAPSGTAGNAITFTQAMTLDASGNLLVGTTSADPITSQVNGISLGGDSIIRACVNSAPSAAFSRRGTDGTLLAFHKNVNGVGSISVTTSATAYNTSSDYRLKQNIAPMVGALDTVAQLKPVTYNWKADGSDGQGFIAHELAEIVPDCVVGEKDAVNEDGSIKAQAIDTSFLVATLTAAIQELTARLDEQQVQISVLQGAK